ncbi:MAG: hypothetical protein GWN00_16425, partial [Aliifodinibius sp.]|nr:hypothetical protein [Fodinibius sp.]NIY26332.1 hypothetical protein [Fodinibius sp.]
MKTIIDAARSMKGMRHLTRSYCEDKIVGELLWLNNIQPGDEDFDAYINSDKQHELVPEEKHAVGFLPGSHTPGKVARTSLGSSMYEIREKMLSNAVWPKKIWPTYHKPTIKPNTNQLELLTDTTKVERLLREGIVLVSVVRNEIEILPHFCAHYRAMGVKCFIFVDNCSNDGTREFLLAQDDAFVYSADT